MGFSADWLALREPADRAARDGGLLVRAARAAGPRPVILDLGCGTGAMLRALAPHLPAGARWRLLDSDPDLLRHAVAQAEDGAQAVRQDLGRIEALPLEGVTLVTASALIDLVSEDWLGALAARLKVPFYASLCYDGVMTWRPEDQRDAPVRAAFNRHQRIDKGLGPALGPEAAGRAQAILEGAGFEVSLASSPWRLGPDMAALQKALTDGIAAAAAEAGATEAPAWGAVRSDGASRGSCVIGHVDLLAIPRPEQEDATPYAD
jgi:SAM-dependent methyltransferase